MRILSRWTAALRHAVLPSKQLGALRPATGDVIGTASIVESNTVQKLAEEKFGRMNRVYAVLSGINALIVHVHDRQELFDGACRIAVEEGKFGMAWLGMRDPASLDILPRAWSGPESDMSAFRSSVSPDEPRGRGVAGCAFRDAKPAVENDLRRNIAVGAGRRAELVALGYWSAIGLPISVDGSPVGTLTLYARGAGYFNDDEIGLLEELTRNISFALENIGKEEKIARLSRIQSVMSNTNALIARADSCEELFNGACRIAVEHGKFHMVWIGLLDPQTLDVRTAASLGMDPALLAMMNLSASADVPEGRGATGHALREKKPAVINDIVNSPQLGTPRGLVAAHGYNSVISLPLVVEGNSVAAMNLFAHEAGFFSAEEVSLLIELAGDLSFALDNMAKREKLAKLSRIRLVSSEINRAIVRIREGHALLRETCRIAVERGKFPLVWVGSLDSRNHELHSVASSGFPDEVLRTMAWPNASTPGLALTEVLRTGRLVIRNDLEIEQAGGILRTEAIRRGCRSNVCLPFKVGGEVVAAAIFFAGGRGFFDEEEIVLLEEMADNVSFALENIGNEAQIARLSRIRTVTGEINSLIARAKDRQELFDGACRIAVEHGKFSIAWIGALDPATLDVNAVAWAGECAQSLSGIKSSGRLACPEGRGAVGRAIRARHLIFNNNVVARDSGGPRLKEILKLGVRSNVTLPLFEGETVAATFTMYAKEPDFFNEEEVKLLNGLARDVSFALEGIAKKEKLEYLASYDALTGLPNRALFRDRLALAIARARLAGSTIALLLLDLDRFKQINESLGHSGGDKVLQAVTARLRERLHDADTIGRLGGDEFAVVIEQGADETQPYRVAENLVDIIGESLAVDDEELFVTASVGVAVYPADADGVEKLIENAELAMYQAKHDGRNAMHAYTPAPASRRGGGLSMESKLRRALERDEFLLHFQPKVNIHTGAITGAEALVRWRNPELGLVSPADFIPLAEETGLIVPIGEWVMHTACRQASAWHRAGHPIEMAVNLSARQFRKENLYEIIEQTLADSGLDAAHLELEITESMIMHRPEQTIATLQRLHDIGIKLSVDDFGTGYSSLSYLKRFPVHTLKIDQSFVRELHNDPNDTAIVRAVVALAQSLNLKTVAEGVETREQLDFLTRLNCDEYQGYYFSRPVPAEDFLRLLQARRSPLPRVGKTAGGAVKLSRAA